MICPNCGSNIEDGLEFCTECGNKIESTGLSEVTASPSTVTSASPNPAPAVTKKEDVKKKKEKPKKEKKPNNKPKFYRFMLWFSIFGMALFGAIDGIWHFASGIPESTADFAGTSYETLCSLFGIALIVCAILSVVTWLVLILRSWIAPYTTAGTCLLIALVNFGIHFISKWKVREIFDSNAFYYTERLVIAFMFVILAAFNFIYLKKKKKLIGERLKF